MNIYVLIFFILTLMCYVEIQNKKQVKIIEFVVFCFLFLFFFVFVGCREVGFDYLNYQEAFKYLSNSYWNDNRSILGYELVYAYLNYFINNYSILICVMSFFIITILFFCIYRFSPYYFVPLFSYNGLFLYTFTMGQYRQMAAVSCILIAIYLRKIKVLSILLFLLGCLFHTSALVALLYFFVKDKLYSNRVYIFALLIAFLMNLAFKPILMQLMGFMPSYIASKLDLYFSVEKHTLGLNSITFFRLLILYLAIKYNKSTNFENQEFFINAFFIGLVYYIAFGFLPQLAGRGSIYFSIAEIFVVSNLIYGFSYRKRLIYFTIYAMILGVRLLSFFAEWHDDFIPYKNWLI